MPMLEAAFLLGATVGVTSMVPGAVVCVVFCRYLLRRTAKIAADCDNWRAAAANAAVAARAAEFEAGTDDVADDDYTGG